MSDKFLHIVSFDIPYPANYGGVIDVYYKIKALHKKGVKVILHAFHYGRERQAKLDEICYRIHYYPRKRFSNVLSGSKPFIVYTRRSEKLLNNLASDSHPVLFEGLHCCRYLDAPALKNKVRIVRMHNIEHLYYANLARIESSRFKKLFFNTEATRLKRYEKEVLSSSTGIATISPFDQSLYKLKYQQAFYLPVFHPNEEITIREGSGNFALYHGNLSVGENDEAAKFLIEKVFSKCNYPFVIAGMRPSKELRQMIPQYDHISLMDNLDSGSINQLIEEAHINILPTFQGTGIKLKLINALFRGRHCIVNNKMVANTGLEEVCNIAANASDFIRLIEYFKDKAFTDSEKQDRKQKLLAGFSNEKNIDILLKKLYD